MKATVYGAKVDPVLEATNEALERLEQAHQKWVRLYKKTWPSYADARKHKPAVDKAASRVYRAQKKAEELGAGSGQILGALGIPYLMNPIMFRPKVEERLYTIKETAQIVEMSFIQLLRLIEKGDIQASRRKPTKHKRSVWLITSQEVRRLVNRFVQPQELLTPSQAARVIGVTRSMVDFYIKAGHFDVVRWNDRLMLQRHEVDSFSKKRQSLKKKDNCRSGFLTNPTAKRKG